MYTNMDERKTIGLCCRSLFYFLFQAERLFFKLAKYHTEIYSIVYISELAVDAVFVRWFDI